MILQALAEYYQRRAASDTSVVRPGYSEQKITFEVVLEPNGTLFAINPVSVREEIPQKSGKVKVVERPKLLNVPGQAKPSGSGLNPCLLWDNTAYLLGYKPEDPKPERTRESFAAFRDKHVALQSEITAPGFSAVCGFLRTWDPARIQDFPEIMKIKSGFGVFKVRGEAAYAHEHPTVQAWWDGQQNTGSETPAALCLVSGTRQPIAATHKPAIKGVMGAQSSGAMMVSYNCDAFESFGKEQGANAPVGESAAFAYGNALNILLQKDRQRLILGDATVVFWTDNPADQGESEEMVGIAIDPAGMPPQDEALRQRIERIMDQLAEGTLPEDGFGPADTRFFILGLSPNAARISIRFWEVSRLGELARRLQRHFDHIRIQRQYGDQAKRPDPKLPAIWQLLDQTCPLKSDKPDREKIPPLLGGALLRAILTGSDYPEALALAVLRRQRVNRDVNYLQAAILRGWLVRNHKQTVPHMLDLELPDPAYRLGRLFAALEKTQQDALGMVNAGISERYYGSASATPGSVFPRLLRGYQHHLGKLHAGQKVIREKLTQEILSALPGGGFPRHLTLQQQGQFAIGYYHQRQSFFEKTKTE